MPFILNTDKEITPELIASYIKIHRDALSERYQKLQDYYEGRHDILKRKPRREDDPCNNIAVPFPKYITDMAAGYHIGEGVAYQSDEENLDDLNKLYKRAEVDVQDMDNAKYQSIYGVAYEIVYMSSDDSPTPKTASIHPSQAFVIYNSTVELHPVAGVYYYEIHDKQTQAVNGFVVEATTANAKIKFKATKDYAIDGEVTAEANPFGMVTLIEIYNNDEKQGDFEQVIPLIDGYNKQQSNRVDDKENFVNSLMVLKGQTLGDTDGEKADTYRSIKENGVIELTPDGDLSFLTRQGDAQGDDMLRQSLADDIHKFSYVPSFTDKDFAGNVSGVAMQFKLFGLNQLMKSKDRYTKEGLRYRIKLFSAIMQAKGMKPVDPASVNITITHSMPKNLQEIAQVIGSLEGVCSKETLVAQLPFVDDPEAEVKKADEERQRLMDEQFVMASSKAAEMNENEE